jgi:hypothetical protein
MPQIFCSGKPGEVAERKTMYWIGKILHNPWTMTIKGIIAIMLEHGGWLNKLRPKLRQGKMLKEMVGMIELRL